MGEIIFVSVRNDAGRIYDSYSDYWTLVNLSGYKTCELSEIDWRSDNVYLFSPDNGNTKAAFQSPQAQARRCKLILLQLEWPRWKDGVLTGHEKPEYVDEMWVHDRHFFDLTQRFSTSTDALKVRYMFLGGHPQFGNPDYASRSIRWDFVHLLYVYGVREHKMNILHDRGFTFAPNGWGQEREYALRNSRWGLHLQQFPAPFIAPQRFTLFASYGLPIISDYCADPGPFYVFQDALIHWDPRETSVMHDGLRKEAVEHNFNLVREKMTFRSQVDLAVERIGT
jgi:hypothetical protein